MKASIATALLALRGLVFRADSEEDTLAGIDPNAPAAYFVNSGFVFAVEVVENGDVYYHMHVSSVHSWMGIGFGDSMSNTRMMISYLAADGGHLTNSCRMSYGHSEPEHDPDCVIEKVTTDHYAPFENTISPDGVLIAHAVCRNCSSWAGGSIDVHSKQQPFIYALGPNTTLHSDDLDAPLRLHEFFGTFNMDMTVATNYTGDYGRVPAPQDPKLAVGHAFWSFGNYYSSTPYSTGTLAEWAPTAHAVFMCLAFLLIFPLGSLSLRLTRRATVHGAAQLFGTAFVLIGFALGIYAARLYNKSKHFNTTHQIIGLLVVAGLFLQIGLGIGHHLMFLRSGTSTVFGKIHRFLGMFIMVLAIVNGGIGLKFADSPVTAYVIVVAIMAALFAGLTVLVMRYSRRHVYKPEKKGFTDEPHHGTEPPAEYEMHDAPFARMGSHAGHVQTPRTPMFRNESYDDDPDNYRTHLARSNMYRNAGAQGSAYTDAASASDAKNPFQTKWEAVPVP